MPSKGHSITYMRYTHDSEQNGWKIGHKRPEKKRAASVKSSMHLNTETHGKLVRKRIRKRNTNVNLYVKF